MKKMMSVVLIASMFVGSFAIVAPSEAKTIDVKIDGQILEMDQPPVVQQGRTLVPLRAIFEGLGAEVTWYQSSGSIFCYRDGATIDLTVNDRIGYINGERVTLDVPPIAVNGRTMVPVRVVSEALGAICEWKGEQSLVDITSNDGYVGVMRVDYENLLPQNLRFVSDEYGWHYAIGNFINQSPYPVQSYSLSYMDKRTTEMHYLTCFETVMPGEKSPKMQTFLEKSGRMSDIQYQKLNIKFKTPYGEFTVQYDYQLQEIELILKSSM